VQIDGSEHWWFEDRGAQRGLDLPCTTFDKLRQVSQATIVENKCISSHLI